MSKNKYTLMLGVALITSGCENTPYYPEPFGTIKYTHEGGGVLKKDIRNINSGIRAAIGARVNPIVDITSIANYHALQNSYLQQFAIMSSGIVPPDQVTEGMHKITKKPSFKQTKLSISDNAAKSKVLECGNHIEVDVSGDEPNESGLGKMVHSSEPKNECLVSSVSWEEIAFNGTNYIDAVCHDYLRQIYRLQKNTDGLRNLTANVALATNNVLPLTSSNLAAITKTMQVVGLAFGLGLSAFDIYKDSILINVDYSQLRGMVKGLQHALVLQRQSGINSRSKAVRLIQDYLFLCTPQAIEAAVNTQIGGAPTEESLKKAGILLFDSNSKADAKKAFDEQLEAIKLLLEEAKKAREAQNSE